VKSLKPSGRSVPCSVSWYISTSIRSGTYTQFTGSPGRRRGDLINTAVEISE
jgi:hypothetical protein